MQFKLVQQMPGANRIFYRIASAPDQEQLQDYLAEIRYAVVFAGLGFQVTIEPLGAAGPDLKVARNGHEAIVEVMRFRNIYPGPPMFEPDKDLTLHEYGNPTEMFGRLHRNSLGNSGRSEPRMESSRSGTMTETWRTVMLKRL